MFNINSILRKFFYSERSLNSEPSKLIIEEIKENKPSMIARFGSVDVKGALYPPIPFLLKPEFKS